VPDHPVLSGPGWWQRPGRFYAEPVVLDGAQPVVPDGAPGAPERPSPRAPILITGASGTLGRAFARLCEARGLAHRLVSRNDLDIADAQAVQAALDRYEPWAIVNAAGYVRVDDAERDADRCFRENTKGAHTLAMLCAKHRVALATFSSDLVFDGTHDHPYVESDAPAPLNVYGRSKAEAERRVLDTHPDALVVRTSAFFGPWDDYNYITVALRALRSGERFLAADDMVVSPTYVPDLVNATLDLLVDRAAGIWHLSNGDAVTWAELAERAAALTGLPTSSLVRCTSSALNFRAPRPVYSALGSGRSVLMPPLQNALARYASLCAG
jgi:dTDP-4-dehydrorhamnose reductase